MYEWSRVIFAKKSKFHDAGGPDTVVSPSVSTKHTWRQTWQGILMQDMSMSGALIQTNLRSLKRKFVVTINTSKNLSRMTMIMISIQPTTTAHGAKNNFEQNLVEIVMRNLHAKLWRDQNLWQTRWFRTMNWECCMRSVRMCRSQTSTGFCNTSVKDSEISFSSNIATMRCHNTVTS